MAEGELIHGRIITIMRSIGAIGKDSQNKEQRYNYRSIDAIYDRLSPLMATHGVYAVPKVVECNREEGTTKSGSAMHRVMLQVEFTFYAEDGSCVTVTTVGEGMDTSDKAAAKAQTAAYKTALTQMLAIPFTSHDPDSTTPSWAAKLEGRISRTDLTAVKKRWMAGNAEGTDKTPDDLAVEFAEWVKATTGREFDPLNEHMWQPDDLAKCLGAFNAEPEATPEPVETAE
jgi:hypothetical protein